MENIIIKPSSVFGNFKWSAEFEIPAEHVEAVCTLGGLQLQQRTPSSKAEKAMAGYDKRPVGFKRDSIAYSEAGAAILNEAVSIMEIVTGRDAKGEPIVVTLTSRKTEVEAYEGTAQDVKMPDERAAYGRFAERDALATLAERVSYTGDLGSGEPTEAPVAFLRAIKAWSKAAIAGLK